MTLAKLRETTDPSLLFNSCLASCGKESSLKRAPGLQEGFTEKSDDHVAKEDIPSRSSLADFSHGKRGCMVLHLEALSWAPGLAIGGFCVCFPLSLSLSVLGDTTGLVAKEDCCNCETIVGIKSLVGDTIWKRHERPRCRLTAKCSLGKCWQWREGIISAPSNSLI